MRQSLVAMSADFVSAAPADIAGELRALPCRPVRAHARSRRPDNLSTPMSRSGQACFVPARDIRRLLAERPQAIGLALPAMPVGSPGMEGPAYNGRGDADDVLLLLADGSARVYPHHA